jgi:hypothetical protein
MEPRQSPRRWAERLAVTKARPVLRETKTFRWASETAAPHSSVNPDLPRKMPASPPARAQGEQTLELRKLGERTTECLLTKRRSHGNPPRSVHSQAGAAPTKKMETSSHQARSETRACQVGLQKAAKSLPRSDSDPPRLPKRARAENPRAPPSRARLRKIRWPAARGLLDREPQLPKAPRRMSAHSLRVRTTMMPESRAFRDHLYS